MANFLVIFDRKAPKAEVREFVDEISLQEARIAAEGDAPADVEVASLTAPSLDELRQTHARYFVGTVDMIGELREQISR